MSIWRLVTKEILHRKVSFVLALASVIVAVGCLVAALALLRAHDLRTEQIIAAKEAATQEDMRALEDDYRKITKKLGFNILILPQAQSLADLYAGDYGTTYMPEEYVDKLAGSGLMTIRHLLPMVQQKLKWPEKKRTIILTGTRGEAPMVHLAPKKALLAPVPQGAMIVGYELHQSLELSVGQKMKLLDREFTVTKCRSERGNKDDITVWINLAEAQELFGKQGQINGILALQCFCPDSQLAQIREEISKVLPDTQVIEFATQVVVRAEARQRAHVAATQAIEAEKVNRLKLRHEREAFADVLIPVVIAGCIVWIGFLAFGNVRERRNEIGILRAIGLRPVQIFIIFLAKAVLIGLLGGLAGYCAGFLLGAYLAGRSVLVYHPVELFDADLLLIVVCLAPILTALASWIPAMQAAQQDPAIVLRRE